MNKKWICVLLAVLLLCGALTACAPAETSSKYVHSFSASIGTMPLDDILEEYPTVLRGTISKQGEAEDIVTNDPNVGTVRTVRTFYHISVTEFFQGDKAYEEEATFWTTGGETDTQVYLPLSGKMPEVGQEEIFFIHPSGCRYGFFVNEDGCVNVSRGEVPELFEDDEAKVRRKLVPVEEFEAILRAKIAAKNSEK